MALAVRLCRYQEPNVLKILANAVQFLCAK